MEESSLPFLIAAIRPLTRRRQEARGEREKGRKVEKGWSEREQGTGGGDEWKFVPEEELGKGKGVGGNG
jgi:hypothetical protein